jgi:chromosome segregation ATPase
MMWSGSTALSNIDSVLKTVRDDIDRLDQNLTRLTESLTENLSQQSRVINEIARVRLMEIDTGQLEASLTAADLNAKKILSERAQQIVSIEQEISALKQQLEQAESQRKSLLHIANGVSKELADNEAIIQTALKDDAVYLMQFERASKAESITTEALQKSQIAQSDMDKKDEPYQNDKLFMYLWNRQYGTPDYAGGVFTRALDNWVAGLIKYERNRVNYWNLQEIPKRLAAHAERVKSEADDEFMALQALEKKALAEAGVPAIQQRLDNARQTLDEQDDRIEEIERLLRDTIEQRARFASGSDEYTQQSLKCLSDAMAHKDVFEIDRYVRATLSPVDDELVRELHHFKDNYEDNEDDLADLRRAHAAKIGKLKELESVRHNFKNNRYDDIRSGFANEALIQSVLGQFLQGVVAGADVWRVIQRNQRHDDRGAQPDFGSGGISGRSPSRHTANSNSTFTWPSSRNGSGGFRLPGSGRSSQRSGGRNGGGGFTTGGGF